MIKDSLKVVKAIVEVFHQSTAATEMLKTILTYKASVYLHLVKVMEGRLDIVVPWVLSERIFSKQFKKQQRGGTASVHPS